MQRRFAALILILLLALSAFCPAALSEPAPQIAAEAAAQPEPEATQPPVDYSQLTADWLDCQSAVLIDADSGNILFAKDDKIRMHPASTTKIMTLLLAVESGIPMDREIAIPQAAADVPKDSSLIPVYPGETMTFGDLLLGVSINSGNDGSNAVAVLVSGTVDNFVKRMNARAEELGCEGTHFSNAHGYTQDNHYTTAYDLALITKTAMQNDEFRRIAGTVEATINVRERGDIKLRTEHMLMRPDSEYYYPYCVGVKTGTTDAAGNCFVGAAEKDGAHLISVVLNCSTKAKRWIDTAYLFAYGWTCYDVYTLEQMYTVASPKIAGFVVSDASEDDINGGRLNLEIAQISSSTYLRMVERNNPAALPAVEQEFIAGSRLEITHPMTAPISKGEIMGTYTFTDSRTGEVITATLVAGRDIAKKEEKHSIGEYLKKNLPFLKMFGNTLFKILLVVLILIILLIIVLVIVRRVQKQRTRKRILERRRQEYLRQMRMQRRQEAQEGRGYRGNGEYPPRRTSSASDRQRRPGSVPRRTDSEVRRRPR